MDVSDFHDDFVREVGLRLLTRYKALSHQGTLTLERSQDAFEWVSAKVDLTSHVAVVLLASEKNFVEIVVSSTVPADAGRVLARVRGARCVANARLIVDTYEQTLALTRRHRPRRDGDLAQPVRKLWASISLEIVD